MELFTNTIHGKKKIPLGFGASHLESYLTIDILVCESSKRVQKNHSTSDIIRNLEGGV